MPEEHPQHDPETQVPEAALVTPASDVAPVATTAEQSFPPLPDTAIPKAEAKFSSAPELEVSSPEMGAELLPAQVASSAGEAAVEAQVEKPVATSASPSGEEPAVAAGQARPADPSTADDVLTKRLPGSESADAAVLSESRQHTRRAFVGFVAGAAAAYGAYRYLEVAPGDEMQPKPLRRLYGWNARVSRDVFRERPLAPTYKLSEAAELRVNGIYGLKRELIPSSWRLQMVGVRNDQQHPHFVKDVTAWEYQYSAGMSQESQGHDTKVDPTKVKSVTAPAAEKMPEKMLSSARMAPAGREDRMMKAEAAMPEQSDQKEDDNDTGRPPRGMEEAGESDSTLNAGTSGLLLQLADLDGFPRHEMVTQFKCIEGWSQITQWAGFRMADFLEAYPPELIDGKEPKYVYLETPDGDYYVGYDLKVLRHPQTLIVTEMMGRPLTQFHGAPIRLHTPLKYGYKQIKRIGLIAYTNDKPDDYWTKLGYDWYGGL